MVPTMAFCKSGEFCVAIVGNLFCNSVRSYFATKTRKVPREMFMEEQKYLFHVKPYSEVSSTVASFDKDGVVNYKGNRYQINTGMMDAHKRIRIEDDGEMLLFYDAETNDLLAKYPVTKDTGQLFKPEENYRRDRVSLTIIKQYFAEYEIAQEFIRRMEQQQPKYFNTHCIRLYRMTKFYTIGQLLDGIEYCIDTNAAVPMSFWLISCISTESI